MSPGGEINNLERVVQEVTYQCDNQIQDRILGMGDKHFQELLRWTTHYVICSCLTDMKRGTSECHFFRYYWTRRRTSMFQLMKNRPNWEPCIRSSPRQLQAANTYTSRQYPRNEGKRTGARLSVVNVRRTGEFH